MIDLVSTTAVLALSLPAADVPPAAADPAPAAKESSAQAAADFIFQSRDLIEDFKAGRWEECARKARVLAEKDPSSYLPAYYVTACYSHLKDEKQGVEWVQGAREGQ